MVPDAVVAMRRRLPAIPWAVPITVHFACDDKPLYGCRLCILRHGLRAGDRRHLFGSEVEALEHIATHAKGFEPPAEERRTDRPLAAERTSTGRAAKSDDRLS